MVKKNNADGVFLLFFHFSIPTISKEEKLRAVETKSIMGIEGLEAGTSQAVWKLLQVI